MEEEQESNQITVEDTFKLFKQMKTLFETINKIRTAVVVGGIEPSSFLNPNSSTLPTSTLPVIQEETPSSEGMAPIEE